jgi:hypothetical protein
MITRLFRIPSRYWILAVSILGVVISSYLVVKRFPWWSLKFCGRCVSYIPIND